ncbi:MAG TPA: FAD:protein FMN transferase [Chitinophagaceae bacterium]|nr:FAD:protein FMN transferase [Chitinophagaceae bacterium]
MGSAFTIIAFHIDSALANKIVDDAYRLVDSLNMIFSDYEDSSEVTRLSATAGKDSFVTVSPHLFKVVEQSQKAWKQTRGKFDITIGSLSRLWRSARKQKAFPEPVAIQEALSKTGSQCMVLNSSLSKVKLLKPGMQLDLGGIAAGYIAQQVAEFLSSRNIRSALVDASGDIVCTNAPPGKSGWTVAVNMPGEEDKYLEKTIELSNASVSTSGDVYQYITHNGKRYSHIIDATTGYGTTFQRNVTVIAADGSLADWLATACSILPLRKAKRLARLHRAALLITEMNNDQLKMHSTNSMQRYLGK